MKSYVTLLDDNKMMTGTEVYPIIGDLIEHDLVSEIYKRFKGLKAYWDCLEKARITAEMTKHIFTKSLIAIGALDVYSTNMIDTYGYDFRPPYQFHAWVVTPLGYVDLALPGVIECGCENSDNVGKMLVGRTPAIYAVRNEINHIHPKNVNSNTNGEYIGLKREPVSADNPLPLDLDSGTDNSLDSDAPSLPLVKVCDWIKYKPYDYLMPDQIINGRAEVEI